MVLLLLLDDLGHVHAQGGGNLAHGGRHDLRRLLMFEGWFGR